MKGKGYFLLNCLVLLGCIINTGCSGSVSSENEIEEMTTIADDNNMSSESDINIKKQEISDYEIADGDIATYISYNYEGRWMYIAGLKAFEEFGASNEGDVSISADGKLLTFHIIKATGTVTGAVDGPRVYFEMNLDTNEIINEKFEPAPNYVELGMKEYKEHSEEVINLSDDRMVEIGKYFKKYIAEIESY